MDKNFGNTFFRENSMNKSNGPVKRIKIGLLIGLLAILTGCAAFWGGGYYYGDAVVVSEPDMYLFGGDYYRGGDEHNYSHRGSESRRVAHTSSEQSRVATQSSGGQSRGAEHSSGGKGERR
jgi:hypothetical protein